MTKQVTDWEKNIYNVYQNKDLYPENIKNVYKSIKRQKMFLSAEDLN